LPTYIRPRNESPRQRERSRASRRSGPAASRRPSALSGADRPSIRPLQSSETSVPNMPRSTPVYDTAAHSGQCPPGTPREFARSGRIPCIEETSTALPHRNAPRRNRRHEPHGTPPDPFPPTPAGNRTRRSAIKLINSCSRTFTLQLRNIQHMEGGMGGREAGHRTEIRHHNPVQREEQYSFTNQGDSYDKLSTQQLPDVKERA
jgi:hypothetical protein